MFSSYNNNNNARATIQSNHEENNHHSSNKPPQYYDHEATEPRSFQRNFTTMTMMGEEDNNSGNGENDMF